MPGFRVDKCLRVGCGAALLLLLAAQEKVCPWLLGTRSGQQPAEPTTDAPADDQPDKPRKPRLPLVLSDASPPRWSSTWSPTALRQAAGNRDGVVSCGPRERTGNGAAAATEGDERWAWHCFLQLPSLVGLVGPRGQCLACGDPALCTCIARTGPPRG